MSTAGESLDRGPQPEHRLRASRRLDWRFLLPDGRLAHVGYLGNRDTTLLASLEMFSESVTVLGPHDWTGGDDGRFDVLVLQAPRREMVRRAGRLLRPGGFLYAEIPLPGTTSCLRAAPGVVCPGGDAGWLHRHRAPLALARVRELHARRAAAIRGRVRLPAVEGRRRCCRTNEGRPRSVPPRAGHARMGDSLVQRRRAQAVIPMGMDNRAERGTPLPALFGSR